MIFPSRNFHGDNNFPIKYSMFSTRGIVLFFFRLETRHFTTNRVRQSARFYILEIKVSDRPAKKPKRIIDKCPKNQKQHRNHVNVIRKTRIIHFSVDLYFAVCGCRRA